MLTYLLTLLYFTLLTLLKHPWFKAFGPEAYAHKHFYALKETKFTVYRYAGIRAAGSLQPAGRVAAGWGAAGCCRLGAAGLRLQGR